MWANWDENERRKFHGHWCCTVATSPLLVTEHLKSPFRVEFSELGGSHVLKEPFVANLFVKCMPSAPCYGPSLAYVRQEENGCLHAVNKQKQQERNLQTKQNHLAQVHSTGTWNQTRRAQRHIGRSLEPIGRRERTMNAMANFKGRQTTFTHKSKQGTTVQTHKCFLVRVAVCRLRLKTAPDCKCSLLLEEHDQHSPRHKVN